MPASGSDKSKLFGKNKNPLNTHRVVISDTQKSFQDKAGNTADIEPVDAANIYEESFLEDTPAEGAAADLKQEHRAGKPRVSKTKGLNRNKKKSSKSEGYRANNTGSPKTESFRGNNTGSPKTESFGGNKDIIPEKPAAQKVNAAHLKTESFRSSNTERRYKANRKSVFSVFSAIPDIFSRKSKTSNSSALEFAGSRRRVGKKGRRNRRIFIYAGTGLAVAILTLLIVFVPGKAATTENPEAAQSPRGSQTTAGSYVAVNTPAVSGSDTIISESPAASGSVSPSVSPTPSPTPIPTTSKDVLKPVIDLDEEVQTFVVKADKYYSDMGYSPNHYKYTAAEKYMLAQVISAEARGEPFTGQIAVGNVIMNRVLNKKKFGNTIAAVVTPKYQFAYNPDTVPTYSAKRAAEQVLDYEQWVVPQNTYYFRVSRSSDYWHGTYLKHIDSHAFYTNNYSGRSTVKSVPPQLFKRIYKWPTMGCEPEKRVYKLQYMLNKLGYSKVVPDQYFGQDTKDAIIDFQKKHKLTADGIAGEKTIRKLIIAFGEDNYYDKFCKD